MGEGRGVGLPALFQRRRDVMVTRRVIVLPLFLLLFCSGDVNGEDQVQSKILSAVSDGVGGYKVVNGMAKGAILRANFTNRINTTGSVESVHKWLN